jgi:hypothetical protein
MATEAALNTLMEKLPLGTKGKKSTAIRRAIQEAARAGGSAARDPEGKEGKGGAG